MVPWASLLALGLNIFYLVVAVPVYRLLKQHDSQLDLLKKAINKLSKGENVRYMNDDNDHVIVAKPESSENQTEVYKEENISALARDDSKIGATSKSSLEPLTCQGLVNIIEKTENKSNINGTATDTGITLGIEYLMPTSVSSVKSAPMPGPTKSNIKREKYNASRDVSEPSSATVVTPSVGSKELKKLQTFQVKSTSNNTVHTSASDSSSTLRHSTDQKTKVIMIAKSNHVSTKPSIMSFAKGDFIERVSESGKWHKGILVKSSKYPCTGKVLYYPPNFVKPKGKSKARAK